MGMLLKVNEVCPIINCKYKKTSGQSGECHGAMANRATEFNCNFIEIKEVTENEMPIFPDTTIRGKTLLHE